MERNVNGPGAAATFNAVHSKLIFDVDIFNQTFTVDVTEDDTEEAQMDFHASITVSPANDEGRCTISDGSVQFAVEASDDTIRLQPRLRHKVSNVNLASHPPACTMFSSLSAAKARLVWLMGRVNSAPSSLSIRCRLLRAPLAVGPHFKSVAKALDAAEQGGGSVVMERGEAGLFSMLQTSRKPSSLALKLSCAASHAQ